VELDVYSGPYEGLLTLILKDEVEIFEVPLRELVALYGEAHAADGPALERDADFVDSAASLVLLKGRSLLPALLPPELADEEVDPEELEERLTLYLKVRSGAGALGERLRANAGSHRTAHALEPRAGRLRVSRRGLEAALRRLVARTAEPETGHLGPITVTVGELVGLIRASLAAGPVRFEDLVRDMDRLRSAVAFAAALSLAQEGHLALDQTEPFGPLTLHPRSGEVP
jgi:segregation and condensation protein A